jgi:hypothetical protein
MIDRKAMFSKPPVDHGLPDINDHDGDALYLWTSSLWPSFIDDHEMQVQASRHLTGAKQFDSNWLPMSPQCM